MEKTTPTNKPIYAENSGPDLAHHELAQSEFFATRTASQQPRKAISTMSNDESQGRMDPHPSSPVEPSSFRDSKTMSIHLILNDPPKSSDVGRPFDKNSPSVPEQLSVQRLLNPETPKGKIPISHLVLPHDDATTTTITCGGGNDNDIGSVTNHFLAQPASSLPSNLISQPLSDGKRKRDPQRFQGFVYYNTDRLTANNDYSSFIIEPTTTTSLSVRQVKRRSWDVKDQESTQFVYENLDDFCTPAASFSSLKDLSSIIEQRERGEIVATTVQKPMTLEFMQRDHGTSAIESSSTMKQVEKKGSIPVKGFISYEPIPESSNIQQTQLLPTSSFSSNTTPVTTSDKSKEKEIDRIMVKFKASKEMDNDTTSNTAEKLQQLYAKELGSSKLAKIFENPSTFEIGAGNANSYLVTVQESYLNKEIKHAFCSSWVLLQKYYPNKHVFEFHSIAVITKIGKKYSKIPGIDFQYVIAKYVLATKYPKYSQVEQNLSNPRIKLWIGRYMALGKYLVWCIFDQCNKANFAGANAETREQEERIVTNATSDEINMALEKVVKHFYQVFYTIYGMIELRFNVEDAFSVFMQHFSDHIKDDMTEGYDHVKAAEKIFETFATQKMVDDIKQILNF